MVTWGSEYNSVETALFSQFYNFQGANAGYPECTQEYPKIRC